MIRSKVAIWQVLLCTIVVQYFPLIFNYIWETALKMCNVLQSMLPGQSPMESVFKRKKICVRLVLLLVLLLVPPCWNRIRHNMGPWGDWRALGNTKLLLVLGLRAICPDYQPERERERSKQKSADMYIHFVACFAQKSKYNDTPRGASNNLQANILSPITLIRSKVQMQ